MFNDEKKPSSLAISLNVYDYVILDTCSLMEEGFPSWMDTLSQAKEYLKSDLAIYVPSACVDELKKHCKAKGEEARRVEAKRAIKILKSAKRTKLISILKTKNGNFADNVIYTKVAEDRLNARILVITQDKKLCSDLKTLNELQSQHGHWIAIEKITPEGELKFNRGEEPRFQRNERNGRGRPYQTPANKPSPTPKSATPVTSFPDDPLVKAKKADERLRAVLNNKTYAESKKKEDLLAQRDLLKSIPSSDKEHLKLFYPESEIEKLLSPASTPEAKEEAKPAPEAKPAEAKQETPAPKAEKPAKQEAQKPVQAEAKKPEAKPAKKLWFEEGETLVGAISAVASHYGVLLRDPSVAYFPAVHGPYDLTSDDASQMANALEDALSKNQSEALYHGFLLSAERKGRLYRVTIDFHPELPDRSAILRPRTDPVPNPIQKEIAAKKDEPAAPKEMKVPAPNAEPKKSPRKAAPKKADSPKEEANPAAGKPAPKKAPAKKKAAPKAVPLSEGSAAVPEGVTLVVGIPDDQKAKERIERSARKLAPSAEAKKPSKEAKKPSKKKTDAPRKETEPAGKPAAKASTKKAPVKKASPKSAAKTEPTPAKPSPKKAEPKKEEAKPSSPKPAKEAAQPEKPTLEQAKKSETRLKTVITNPNYPSEKKAADVEAQLNLIRKLTAEERAELKYGMDALKGMLSLLK